MASIKYEAETQRQHPRFRVPMQAFVNGKTYDVLDWSMGGFALKGATDFTQGQAIEAALTIPFNGYELGVTTTAEARYSSREKNRTGFAFAGLDERQSSILRYISDAIVAGEIVEVGDILDVVKRTGGGRARNLPSAPSRGIMGRAANVGRRLATTAAVMAIVGALGTYLWANIYEQFYVVRAETASVSAKMVNLAAPAVGRLGYLNGKREVALGEPLMTVNPPVGNPIVVQSPCDCLQVDQQFADGDFVKTGDTVVKLMRKDAPVVVSALVPPDRLMSLYGVQKAHIVYADGSRVDDADILWLPGRGGAQEELPREPSSVVLDPKRPLSYAMMGQPVEVTFDLFPGSVLGRLITSISDFGTTAVASSFAEGRVADGKGARHDN